MNIPENQNSRMSTYFNKKLEKRDELSKISVKDLLNLESIKKEGHTIVLNLSNPSRNISLKEGSFAKIINTRLKEGLRSKGVFKASLTENNARSVITKILNMESADESRNSGKDQVALLREKSNSKRKTYSKKGIPLMALGSAAWFPGALFSGPTLGLSMVPTLVLALVGYKNVKKEEGAERLHYLYTEQTSFHHPEYEPLRIKFDDSNSRKINISMQSKVLEISCEILFQSFKDAPDTTQAKYANILNNTRTLIKETTDSINQKCSITGASNHLKDYLIDSLEKLITENLLNKASANNPYYLENDTDRKQLICELFTNSKPLNPLLSSISSIDIDDL